MTDQLFIQFYSRRRNNIYNLINGFSDTYGLCRKHGDFVWIYDEPDRRRWYDYDRYAANPLPIRTGKVYVSALDVNHLYQCWVWARCYPDIDFVVGGPVAAECDIDSAGWDPAYVRVEDPDAIPANLTITGKSVEQWFGLDDFSDPWRLEIPDDIPAGSRIYFSYTLDNACFWRRCIYCNIGLHDRRHVRRRRHMDFEFRQLDFEGTKLVRLNTGSLSPRLIRDLFPALPSGDGFEYRTFVRAADPENQALQEAIAQCDGAFPETVLGYGVEYPTRRMLAHVDKGFGPDEIIRSMEICKRGGVRANGNAIVGWNNLTEQDVNELERFMARLPVGAFKNMQLRWLLAHPRTAIHDRYHGRPIRFGPFYEGFSVELDDPEMIELNRRSVDIFERYAPVKQYKLEGADNARSHLR